MHTDTAARANQIKLIALDLDGTLLNSQWKVSEANRRAVETAIEQGVQVVLVTGRRFSMAEPIALIPLSGTADLPLVCNNGAVIKLSRSHEVLYRNFLPRPAAQQALVATRAFRRYCVMHCDAADYGQLVIEQEPADDNLPLKWYLHRSKEYVKKVESLEHFNSDPVIQLMFGGSVRQMREVAHVLAPLGIHALPNGRPHGKAQACLPPAGRPGSVRQASSARAVRTPRRLRSDPTQPDEGSGIKISRTEYPARDVSLVDVLAPTCSKGAALEFLMRRFGVTRDEVMACGDNFNDVEMLERVGTPVVMENSVDELKMRRRNGWHVTASNDENGVARAIEKFVL